MPVYEARCTKCQHETSYTASIENMYQTPVCCGKPMEKVILTPPKGYVDNPMYMSKYKKLY